jgi:hypothetical protein
MSFTSDLFLGKIYNFAHNSHMRIEEPLIRAGVVIIHRKGEEGTSFKVLFLAKFVEICKRGVSELFPHHL